MSPITRLSSYVSENSPVSIGDTVEYQVDSELPWVGGTVQNISDYDFYASSQSDEPVLLKYSDEGVTWQRT